MLLLNRKQTEIIYQTEKTDKINNTETNRTLQYRKRKPGTKMQIMKFTKDSNLTDSCEHIFFNKTLHFSQ